MGKPVAPDKDEKVKGHAADPEGKHMDPAAHIAGCEDCMKTVAAHMGMGKPADGMKSQDQGGSKSGGAARRRH